MKRLALSLLFASVCATAAPFVYTDTTQGGDLWRRPIAGAPPTFLSSIGTAVPFHVFGFTVSQAGSYNFLSLGTNPTNWDNFLFLYSGFFDPNQPLTNAIIGNDDFPTIGRSGFNGVALTTSTTYFLVTTGFDNNHFGAFENTISGVGIVTPLGSAEVPEPASIVLTGMALAAIAFRVRRKGIKA